MQMRGIDVFFSSIAIRIVGKRDGGSQSRLLENGIRVFLLSGFALSVVRADQADAFFDDSYVHEIRLTFADSDWWNTLYNSHANDTEDPYFPARFEGDGVVIENIGVRFKGNSSFRANSVKKSIKLDFDEYDEENEALSFFGLKKLNLNNSFKDPTMLREKLFLEFASQFIPTIRTVHTRVYVNDEYFGLYVAVEQVDKIFIQDRFGSEEDGNLYKGAASDEVDGGPQADFGSDLVWEGSAESAYYDHYQLKTNEEENDYSGLVSFIDALNNGDPDLFPENLEPLLDVQNALAGLALNSLFVNLDSYNGSAHNFYVYQSDLSGQFSHVLWDCNEAFGSFLAFGSGADPLETDPFWLPTNNERPFMENLWENQSYARDYLNYHARMLRQGFDLETFSARIEELADVIRTDVYADPNKLYSNAEFEANLTSSVSGLYGLEQFVEERAEYLNTELNSYALSSDLRINEIVSLNDSNFTDEAGDSEPWIEIYNPGLGEVSLSGLYLTNEEGGATQWTLPDIDLDDGEFATFWLDGDSGEGANHANFPLSETGGALYLYSSDGSLIDSVAYPSLESDISYQRFSDGEENWIFSDRSTPGAENAVSESPSVTLYINEVLAENDANLQDPAGEGYPDWFELYNPNAFPVDLGGMYLTDNVSIPKHWKVPEGVSIDAESFLLFWADNDEEQGATHTNFKLDSAGDEIALYDTDEYGNVLIDLLEFGIQTPDISYGRDPDGAETFTIFEQPTPGASNSGLVVNSEPISIYVGVGYTLTFEALAEGFGTLTYQWSLDDVEIAGAVSSELELDPVAESDAGVYSVSVSNGYATVDAEIVTLTVDSLDPDGDNDGDGVLNLVESMFGMNPNEFDSDLLPQWEMEEGVASISFEARRDDVDCHVESSTDLVVWQKETPTRISDAKYSFEDVFEGVGPIFYRIRLEMKE